jgi:hypothetical protein
MINTWSELWAAVKTWWNTELNLVRKQKLPEPSEYASILNLKRPPVYSDEWNRREQLDGLSRMSNAYFESLRTRLRQGEHLTLDEWQRLRMDEHVREINQALEHPEEDNNLPDKGSDPK